jgi:hypothetical protein
MFTVHVRGVFKDKVDFLNNLKTVYVRMLKFSGLYNIVGADLNALLALLTALPKGGSKVVFRDLAGDPLPRSS